MKKEKSISRTKKSTVTISELLVREGATALVPGGGLLYDASKALFQHGRQYFKDRTEIRLFEFHQALLRGDFKNKESEQFLHEEFNIEDYYSILSSCVQDIEDEKVETYSQLMRSLILKDLEPNIRRHFITSSKSMTFRELIFLKELYINSKFDLMTAGGTSRQVKTILSSNEILKNLTIEKLISSGFIHKDKSGLTSLGEQYSESIFSPNELTPESIWRMSWTGINIAIVSYQLGNQQHDIVCMAIHESLWEINIKSSIHILDERPITSMFNSAAVLLVGDKKIEDRYLKALKNFSFKKPLVRLNLNTKCAKLELKDISFHDVFTLKSTDPSEIRSEVNELTLKLFSQDI